MRAKGRHLKKVLNIFKIPQDGKQFLIELNAPNSVYSCPGVEVNVK